MALPHCLLISSSCFAFSSISCCFFNISGDCICCKQSLRSFSAVSFFSRSERYSLRRPVVHYERHLNTIWPSRATTTNCKSWLWERSPIWSWRVEYCCGYGDPNMYLNIAGALLFAPPNFPLELILSPCRVRMVGHGMLFCTTCKQRHT